MKDEQAVSFCGTVHPSAFILHPLQFRPHPCPLPEYRARGKQRTCDRPDARCGRADFRLVVIEDRSGSPGEADERVAAGAEQVDVEALVRLPLLVSLDGDRDRLDRLAWGE